MAKFISKSQYDELKDINMCCGEDEFHKFLEKYTGIEARPYTAYSYYDATGDYIGDSNENDLDDLLEKANVVDAVPVVRCKDCEHAERYERTDGTAGYYCGHPQNSFTYGERWNRVFQPVKEANDFCSYGTTKNDGGQT